MQFTYYFPLWVIIFCLIIAVSITIYGYIRIGQPLQRFLRNTLIALRFLSIAILLSCLLAPVIIEKKDITPPTHLSILVDTSQSMQMQDNYSGKTEISRLDQVKELLYNETSQFLNTLNSEYKVHVYNFDSTLYKDLSTNSNFEPNGLLTDIASSIHDAVDVWKGQQNAGIVLMTDGAHNASSFETEDIVSLDTPVYAIGIGSPQRPKDILIKNVEVLPIAYTGHESVLRIAVVQTGFTNESVRVSLRESGSNRLVDAAIVTLTEVSDEQSTIVNGQSIANAFQHIVELKITPEKEGNYQYKVVLPNLEGELTTANNEKTFSLKVVKAKLNIFYLEGRPRWEYAFLKRTLERDPDIDATFAVRSINSHSESVLKQNNGFYPQNLDNQPNQFPETIEELNKFDVLIFGDLSAGHLTDLQQLRIVEFVEKKGKAIIFLPSHTALGRNGFRNTQLAGLLPIQIPANGCLEQKGEFAVELTQAGSFHPMLQLDDLFERNTTIWQNLPALTNAYSGFQLKAGATILLYKQDGAPILLFQRVGLGKSILFAAEGLWNWDFGVNTFKDETYQTVYQRFWAQVIRWMTQESDENRVYISTTSSTYAQGEEVKINVKTFAHTFQQQENIEIQLNVTSPDGSIIPLRARAGTADNKTDILGSFTAKLKVEENGTYKIRAVGMKGNTSIGEDQIDITVQPQLIELEFPQLNETLLKELTHKTGGVYLNIEDAHQLHEKITTVEKPVFVDTKRDFWAHPLLLILIVGLLGSEWFIRKRIGLV